MRGPTPAADAPVRCGTSDQTRGSWRALTCPHPAGFQGAGGRPGDILQIAARLGPGDKTVRYHVSNLLAKLRVTDRASAAASARRAGLGGP